MTSASATMEITLPLGTTDPAHTVGAQTLAGEHALLMREVIHRVEPVLALLETRVWPHAELGTLIAFLRNAVLRQASDEETLLFPHDASAPPFVELSADHVRLHALTGELEAAHAQPCPRSELRTLVNMVLTTLRRHMANEQAVLAALADADIAVPSAAQLSAEDQDWLADESPIVIRVDALPDQRATQLCVERLLRLRPGQIAELHTRDDLRLRAICRWMHDFDAAGFGVSHTTAGTDHVLRVVRRPIDTRGEIGYPG